jgi:hypothetical protein
MTSEPVKNRHLFDFKGPDGRPMIAHMIERMPEYQYLEEAVRTAMMHVGHLIPKPNCIEALKEFFFYHILLRLENAGTFHALKNPFSEPEDGNDVPGGTKEGSG